MSSTSTPARGPGFRYPPKTRNRARRLFTQYSWSQARIARHLDVPEDTVRNWLKDLNPGNGNARRYDRGKILAEWQAGAAQFPPTLDEKVRRRQEASLRAEIRERHGCSERFLSDLLNGKLPP